MISSTSVRSTLEAFDDVLFHQQPLTQLAREVFAIRIISCQIQGGASAGMFNHSSVDGDNAPRLFSGERLYTHLAANHTLLIDSARSLTRLGVKNGAVTRAMELARQRMEARCYAGFCAVGECRHLTIAFMRYLIASGLPDDEQRLGIFLTQLAEQRDGQGKWGRFPFYYTLLMLSETDHPQAVMEQQYAAPACAAAHKYTRSDNLIGQRRLAILQKTQH